MPTRQRPYAYPEWLLNAWDAIQVELHGCYSIQRMQALQTYAQNTSTKRIAGVLLLTPLPCLLAIAIADCIPLQPPELGLNHSGGFWVRASLATWIYSLSMLQQFRCFIVGLPMTDWTCLVLSFPVTILTMAVTFLLVWFVGYPMPFTISVTSVPWAWFMAGVLWLRLGAFFRAQPKKRRELVQFLLVLTCQVSLVIIYPAFNAMFSNLSSRAQALFALLLPVIKLVEKNLFSLFTRHSEDLKPEVVIFNVEVFNALFIACCVQNSNSLATNFVIAGVDFVTACVSLHDLDLILAEVTALAKQMSVQQWELHEALLVLCQREPELEREATQRVLSSRLRSLQRLVRSNTGIAPAPLASRTPQTTGLPNTSAMSQANSTMDAIDRRPPESPNGPPQKALLVDTTDDDYPGSVGRPALGTAIDEVPPLLRLERKSTETTQVAPTPTEAPLISRLQQLRPDDRVVFVQRMLQALHVAEFLLLIEYVEIVIPIVYTIYLVVVYHLPNRMYYPQLRDMDEQKLRRTIGNVMLNAMLELVSLVLLIRVLNKKLRVSPLRQLAFVLDRQWRMVQSKAVLWVVVTVQSTLYHLGADYSFKFAWLSRPPQAHSGV